MPRSERAPARRALIKQIRDVRRRLALLLDAWDAPGRVWVFPDGGGAYTREREPAEYPENQRAQWDATIQAIHAAQLEMYSLRLHCQAERDKTPPEES